MKARVSQNNNNIRSHCCCSCAAEMFTELPYAKFTPAPFPRDKTVSPLCDARKLKGHQIYMQLAQLSHFSNILSDIFYSIKNSTGNYFNIENVII